MAARSADTLFRGVLDYAGMFPPASLAFEQAAAAYQRYRTAEDGWMVGAFVMSADRLAELDPAIGPVSLVMSTASAADVERVVRARGGTAIAALEFRPAAAHQIAAVAVAVPETVQAYFEILPDAELDQRLDAVAACGGSAKIRTGGVTPEAFPTAAALYRFFRGCANRRVGAKATAGLHHALTGRYPLTYESGSPSAPMYGFLNVCAAAALVRAGVPEADVLSVLGESSAAAFRFDETGMAWRDHCLSVRELAETRRTLFRSFGSCSLHEPIDDLKRLQAI
jgi:hypothetical protein